MVYMTELVLCIFIYIIIAEGLFMYCRRIDLVHLLTLALTGFFIIYAMISMCLFAVSSFSIRRCLLVEMGVVAGGLALLVTWEYMEQHSNRPIYSRWHSKGQDDLTGHRSGDNSGREFSACAVQAAQRKMVVCSSLQARWPVYLVVALLALGTQGYNGFYGMGQDQGVYQTEAINLYYDRNDWRQTITDFDDIEDAQYKDYCTDLVQNCLGFNLVGGERTLQRLGLLQVSTQQAAFQDTSSVSSSDNSLEGIYHGLPSYAAMLGLSARIHGIGGMMRIGGTFYTLTLLVFAFFLESQEVCLSASCLLTLLLGLCPQLVWQRKSSLTEGFTALMIMLYLYLILEEDRHLKSLSVLPIAGFAAVHVSIYVVLPVFLVNYWILYWRSLTPLQEYDNRNISAMESGPLRNAIEISLIYLAFFLISVHIQPIYTIRKNYYNPLKRFLHMNWIIPFFLGGVVLAIIISLLLPLLRRKWKEQDGSLADAVRIKGAAANRRVSMNLIMSYIYAGMVVLTVISSFYEVVVRHIPVNQLTIFCYLLLSGLFPLPLICWQFCVRMVRQGSGRIVRDKTVSGEVISGKEKQSVAAGWTTGQILACNMFLWTNLLFSLFMRPRTSYYYYYSRYLAPYISVILVTFVMLYATDSVNSGSRQNRWRKERAKGTSGWQPGEKSQEESGPQPGQKIWGTSKYRVGRMTDGRKADAFTEGRRKSGVARPTNILLALGILFLLPSTLVIVRCQDDTNMQWQTVTAILDQVSPGDIVYLNPDNMLTMYHILRARGAKVYPVMDDLETTVTIVEHETEQAAGAENSDESITGSAAEAVDTDHHDRMQRISSDDNQYTYYLTNSTTELLTATGIDGHHFQITIAVTTATQEDDLSSDDPLTNMPHEFSLRGSQRYVLYRD